MFAGGALAYGSIVLYLYYMSFCALQGTKRHTRIENAWQAQALVGRTKDERYLHSSFVVCLSSDTLARPDQRAKCAEQQRGQGERAKRGVAAITCRWQRCRYRRSCRRGGRRSCSDRGDYIPDTAHALAFRIAGGGIGSVVVQRLAAVGHLPVAIVTNRDTQCAADAIGAWLDATTDQQRRPAIGAAGVAH